MPGALPHRGVSAPEHVKMSEMEKAHAMTTENLNRILKQFVLTKVHSLDDITAVIKHAAYIFSVDGSRKVRIAVVSIVTHSGCYFLQQQ